MQRLTWRHKNWETGGGFGYNYFGGWKDTATGQRIGLAQKRPVIGKWFYWLSAQVNSIFVIGLMDWMRSLPTREISNIPRPGSGDSFAYDQEYLTNG